MARGSLQKQGADNSDGALWATSAPARAFASEVMVWREQAFKKLLKEGEKNHSQNAESYKAYEKVLDLLNEFAKLN